MIRNFSYLLLFTAILLTTACQSHSNKPVILVSKDYDQRFTFWPALGDTGIKIHSLYNTSWDSLDYYLSAANGIIISGGPDIHPAIYGKELDTAICGPLDLRRDTLELIMIRYAMENDIPLLGICRGHQILNAANGGTLIMDIPSEFDTTLIRHSKGNHHRVRVQKESLLHEIIKLDSGRVNTSHHQAVEKLAPGFRAAAYSDDGIIEAIELIDQTAHPFILGVQWHPETMIRESESPFTVEIAKSFMLAVHKTRR